MIHTHPSGVRNVIDIYPGTSWSLHKMHWSILKQWVPIDILLPEHILGHSGNLYAVGPWPSWQNIYSFDIFRMAELSLKEWLAALVVQDSCIVALVATWKFVLVWLSHAFHFRVLVLTRSSKTPDCCLLSCFRMMDAAMHLWFSLTESFLCTDQLRRSGPDHSLGGAKGDIQFFRRWHSVSLDLTMLPDNIRLINGGMKCNQVRSGIHWGLGQPVSLRRTKAFYGTLNAARATFFAISGIAQWWTWQNWKFTSL